MLVDSHCHLDRIKGYTPPEGLLPVTVGYSHASNVSAVRIARKLEIPFVLGIAPQTALRSDLAELGVWEDFIRSNPPRAIGEIGLDYHWAKDAGDVEKEKAVYTRMLDLAEELGLPVVIHARKAASEALDFLELRDFAQPFMLHFFSGTLAEAKRAVSMGGLISIPPLRSKERRAVINNLKLENLLVESDAPYVGRLPEDTAKAVSYIAEVKGIGRERAEEQTAKNAVRFFNIEM